LANDLETMVNEADENVGLEKSVIELTEKLEVKDEELAFIKEELAAKGGNASGVDGLESEILLDELEDTKKKLEDTEDLLVELQDENDALNEKLKTAGTEGSGSGGGGGAELEELKAKMEVLQDELMEMEAMLGEEMEKNENLAADKVKLEIRLERLNKAAAGRGSASPSVAGRGKK
jgi:chromosome segregation ATPase